MTLTRITSDGITDAAIVNADINASAAIARTKLANVDVVDDTSPQLGGDLDTNSHNISLDDAHKVNFGDNADLEIYHNAGFSYIDAKSDQLRIEADQIRIRSDAGETYMEADVNSAVKLYYDNVLKFGTDSAGVYARGDLMLNYADNYKIKLGAGNDLQIYHDGTNSRIHNTTGELIFRTGSNYVFYNSDGSEKHAKFVQNGAVELYHNNAKKFETYQYGIKTSQNIDIGLHAYLADNGEAIFGTGEDLKIFHDGNNNFINIINGNLNFQRNGTTVGAFDGNGDFYITDARKAYFGNGADLKIYHNGSESYILNTGSNLNLGTTSGNNTQIYGNNTVRWLFTYDGHFLPNANNSYDIGSTSLRIRNIYTNDLNLSNEGSSNDVDGTWGSYTIQEGAEDLFLVNKRSGKKYKFNLTEVS